MVNDDDLDRVLAERLRSVWPHLSWRQVGDVPRTIIAMHSIAVYLPPTWQPLLPAYEERYLCYILGLLSRGTRVVYVTSMPIHPRLIDYWFGLIPGLDTPENRSRLTLVPVVDARALPLTRKVLDHPGTVRRIRDSVVDPECAVTMGHTVTTDDVELARHLGVPVYGAHPRFAHWGTKSGSRQAFEDCDVPVAPGVAGVRTRDDVAEAAEKLRAEDPGLARVIVKLDEGASGIGNGTIDLVPGRLPAGWCDAIRLEQPEIPVEEYYDHLARESGVVEAFVVGDEVRSPSVQLRMTPFGEAQVLATHEQVLGGPHGLTYFGCTMPARPDYAAEITRHAAAVGRLLARYGVVGRCAIDFLAVRRGARWSAYGSEINLRAGGTTHPLATLSSLTGGDYDAETGLFMAGGTAKYYGATDHLVREEYAALTTDDLLDVLPRHGLGWNPETQTGTVFHMASAIGGMGTVGLTAIADSAAAADALFKRSRAALDQAAAEL